MKLKHILFTLAALALFSTAQAQVKIGNNPSTIDPSAVLEVESANKGVLPPRLTTSQRDAITNPATGLVLFNTTVNCLQVNTGTPASPNWQCTGSGSSNPAAIFSGKRSYDINENINIINDLQEYPISQSDYTFTSSAGLLSISYTALIDNRHNAVYTIAWNKVEWRLYVDGALVATQLAETNASESLTLAITAYKQVSAGTHTVELRAYQVAGDNGDASWPFGHQGLFVMNSNSYVANVR